MLQLSLYVCIPRNFLYNFCVNYFLLYMCMQYEELCKAIAGMVGSQSTDSVELLHILEQLVQVCVYL